jgi:hypothetical protein
MSMAENCVAFRGHTCVATGSLPEAAAAVKRLIDADSTAVVLVFDAVTSEPVELDLRGSVEDVLARLSAPAAQDAAAPADDAPVAPPAGPGRPRLGVVAREVTLLPRHWEWLGEQPGGASVTLRKLVEEARRNTAGEVQMRRAQEACYRFMLAMAGNEPGFEEALRALYANDPARFSALTEEWPADVREHTRRLASSCFAGGD